MNAHTEAILISSLFGILVFSVTLLFFRQEQLMSDFSKLNGSVSTLSTAVDALIASGSSDQPQIDAAAAQVDAITAKVTAATPAPPTP